MMYGGGWTWDDVWKWMELTLMEFDSVISID